MRERSGVYVFRTRRPGLLGRTPYGVWVAILPFVFLSLWGRNLSLLYGLPYLLLSPRHTAYVGEGWIDKRRKEHLLGGGRYRHPPKPWVDLRPTWYFLRLPYRKFILRSVETAVILLLWPVYNHAKNQWNPRRIPLKVAVGQRAQRDTIGWSFNLRPGHVFLWGVIAVALASWYVN